MEEKKFFFKGDEECIKHLRKTLSRYYEFNTICYEAESEDEALRKAHQKLIKRATSINIDLGGRRLTYEQTESDEIEVIDLRDCEEEEAEQEIECIKTEMIEEFIENHEDINSSQSLGAAEIRCIARQKGDSYQLLIIRTSLSELSENTKESTEQKSRREAGEHEESNRKAGAPGTAYSLLNKLINNITTEAEDTEHLISQWKHYTNQSYPFSNLNRANGTSVENDTVESFETLPTVTIENTPINLYKDKDNTDEVNIAHSKVVLAIGIINSLYANKELANIKVTRQRIIKMEEIIGSETYQETSNTEVLINIKTDNTLESELQRIKRKLETRGSRITSEKANINDELTIALHLSTEGHRKDKDFSSNISGYKCNPTYPCLYDIKLSENKLVIHQVISNGSHLPEETEWTNSIASRFLQFINNTNQNHTIFKIIDEFCRLEEANMGKDEKQLINTIPRTNENNINITGKSGCRIIRKNQIFNSEEINLISKEIIRKIGANKREETRVMLLLETGANYFAAIKSMIIGDFHYLTCDKSYPQARILELTKEFQPQYVVFEEKTRDIAEQLRQEYNFIEVIVSSNTEPLEQDRIRAAEDLMSKKDIFESSGWYSLYTSGSTGTPSMLRQSTKNALYFANRYKSMVGITSSQTITQVGSIAHDATIVDVHSALISHCNVLMYDIKDEGIEGLIDSLNRFKVDVLHCTPTLLRELGLIASRNGKVLANISTIVLGGENVMQEDIRVIKRLCQDNVKVINLYGSSESSISFMHIANINSYKTEHKVPIGRSITDAKWRLQDQDNLSNLFIGELQMEKIYTSIMPDNNDEYYKTGDIMRRLHNGNLVHTGRKDYQVKIRGNRVSIIEVEEILLSDSRVSECCIVDYKDKDGGTELAAYIKIEKETSKEHVNDIKLLIKNHIINKAPMYMVPSRIEIVDKIPKTRTGKLDRNALKLSLQRECVSTDQISTQEWNA